MVYITFSLYYLSLFILWYNSFSQMTHKIFIEGMEWSLTQRHQIRCCCCYLPKLCPFCRIHCSRPCCGAFTQECHWFLHISTCMSISFRTTLIQGSIAHFTQPMLIGCDAILDGEHWLRYTLIIFKTNKCCKLYSLVVVLKLFLLQVNLERQRQMSHLTNQLSKMNVKDEKPDTE